MVKLSDINNIYKLVNEIHIKNKASGNRFVFTTTGGGFSSYSYLMGIPEASNTVLQLNGPYVQEATLKYIENPASLEVASELAITSLKQCREIMSNSKESIYDLYCLKNCYGVGISATLATKQWIKEDHEIHIVVTSDTSRIMFSVNLHKGFPPVPETPEKIFRSRTEEDELCGKLVIFIIAYICKVVTKEFFFESLYKDNFLNISDTFKFYEDIFNFSDSKYTPKASQWHFICSDPTNKNLFIDIVLLCLVIGVCSRSLIYKGWSDG